MKNLWNGVLVLVLLDYKPTLHNETQNFSLKDSLKAEVEVSLKWNLIYLDENVFTRYQGLFSGKKAFSGGRKLGYNNSCNYNYIVDSK